MSESKIIIATNNSGKLLEYKNAFSSFNFNVVGLSDLNLNLDPPLETGNTFLENAEIKAKYYSIHLNEIVIADDSGLVVDSLNGEPGVYSARYAGDHDDEANNEKLLLKLQNKSDRSAHFVTNIVAIKPTGEKMVVTGRLNGEILKKKRGINGFGYDPLFYVPQKDKTLAEMTISEKNSISHRGIAFKKLMNDFYEWI
ncbi:MAG: XTP/dITP diphosphatase [Firmicutes bacterium]|uniref:dITP/XTP pyrophosphatase n=1 Tax=Candidatus Gallilactobacillus intestinavium TaxID=2840838 RepID=A0A9D9H567_9LACO|nr:XTP/dITP diphosphatase [Candidatus Gallilactobacillus intestinavium]